MSTYKYNTWKLNKFQILLTKGVVFEFLFKTDDSSRAYNGRNAKQTEMKMSKILMLPFLNYKANLTAFSTMIYQQQQKSIPYTSFSL